MACKRSAVRSRLAPPAFLGLRDAASWYPKGKSAVFRYRRGGLLMTADLASASSAASAFPKQELISLTLRKNEVQLPVQPRGSAVLPSQESGLTLGRHCRNARRGFRDRRFWNVWHKRPVVPATFSREPNARRSDRAWRSMSVAAGVSSSKALDSTFADSELGLCRDRCEKGINRLAAPESDAEVLRVALPMRRATIVLQRKVHANREAFVFRVPRTARRTATYFMNSLTRIRFGHPITFREKLASCGKVTRRRPSFCLT
jgi:hypothetical protein